MPNQQLCTSSTISRAGPDQDLAPSRSCASGHGVQDLLAACRFLRLMTAPRSGVGRSRVAGRLTEFEDRPPKEPDSRLAYRSVHLMSSQVPRIGEQFPGCAIIGRDRRPARTTPAVRRQTERRRSMRCPDGGQRGAKASSGHRATAAAAGTSQDAVFGVAH